MRMPVAAFQEIFGLGADGGSGADRVTGPQTERSLTRAAKRTSKTFEEPLLVKHGPVAGFRQTAGSNRCTTATREHRSVPSDPFGVRPAECEACAVVLQETPRGWSAVIPDWSSGGASSRQAPRRARRVRRSHPMKQLSVSYLAMPTRQRRSGRKRSASLTRTIRQQPTSSWRLPFEARPYGRR